MQQHGKETPYEVHVLHFNVFSGIPTHPNVLKVLAILQEPPGIVMEFVENGSLYSYLHSNKEIPMNVVEGIIDKIVLGLVHLHGLGIVHRLN